MFGFKRQNPVAVVHRYVDALNAHDAGAMKALLHADCRFVDSHGYCVDGYAASEKAVDAFLEVDPTFRIRVDSTSTRNGEVLMRGEIVSEHPALAGDTLWLAKVEDGKVKYWQSFGKSESLALKIAPGTARPAGEAARMPDLTA